MDPWVEATCLAHGATEVVTVEYNQLTYGNLRTVSGEDFDAFYATEQNSFDVAISLSSFDHDGLGRYGDPLNPTGDFAAMSKMLSILKPGGRCFFSVPIGPDVIVGNLHRRYGRLRLPLLLATWRIEKVIGWDIRKIDQKANWRQTFEPVFVLRKPCGEEGKEEEEEEKEGEG